MHLVAIAAAAGLSLTWDDFAELSAVVPLLARIYPNGPADINHFHAAGGVAVPDRRAARRRAHAPRRRDVAGYGLGRYRDEPYLDDAGELRWRPARRETRATTASCAPRATRSRPTAASACSTARSAAPS